MNTDLFLEKVSSLLENRRRERFGDLSKPASGQVWLVEQYVTYHDGNVQKLNPDFSRPNKVVLMGFDEDFESNPFSVARVFPVSNLSLFAGPFDLTFNEMTSPIPSESIMIECWNPRPMFAVNLLKAIAKVDEVIISDIEHLKSWKLRGFRPPLPLKSAGYVGPDMQSNDPLDPRVQWQTEEVDRTSFLSDPVNFLRQSEEK